MRVRPSRIWERAKRPATETIRGSLGKPGSASGATLRLAPVMDAPMQIGFAAQIPGIALAACMLIAVGLVAMFLSRSPQKLSGSFASAAITRHNLCCGDNVNHHNPNIPHSSLSTVGKYLVQELKHPVMIPNLEQNGFKFDGASICPIDGVDTAHLVYRNTTNHNTISVFSMPGSATNEPGNGHQFESTTDDGHVVIVRQSSGASYCLVGHCPGKTLALSTMTDMFDQHQQEIALSADSNQRIVLADVHYEK